MPLFLTGLSITSIVFCGAIFGFFYAWVCSTMWGLDAADPRTAIAAMQAMNASVRNVVFFPAFFLTPAVAALTAIVAFRSGRRRAAEWFLASAATYLVFGMLLTMTINVPMNEALAVQPVPDDIDAARQVWQAYSGQWQVWNAIRTIASGGALVLATCGLFAMSRKSDSVIARAA